MAHIVWSTATPHHATSDLSDLLIEQKPPALHKTLASTQAVGTVPCILKRRPGALVLAPSMLPTLVRTVVDFASVAVGHEALVFDAVAGAQFRGPVVTETALMVGIIPGSEATDHGTPFRPAAVRATVRCVGRRPMVAVSHLALWRQRRI
jgi:hypothetical protein